MKYSIVILLLIFSTPAIAGLHMGASLVDTRLHSRDYKLVKESEPSISYNFGYYKELPDQWVIDFTTNILVPTVNKRTIISNGITLSTKSKVNYGSFLVGKRFNRFVPSLLISLVHVDKKVYHGKTIVNKDRSSGLVYGGNVNYFVTKQISTSLFCLLPSSHIDLRLSCGGGINYYF